MVSSVSKQILSQTSAIAVAVSAASVATVIDDAAILSDHVYDAAVLANQSKAHKEAVTRQCREQLSRRMIGNRALIGMGLTFFVAGLAICLPSVLPLAIAALSLAAGAYFSVGCAKETIDLFKASKKWLTRKAGELPYNEEQLSDDSIIESVVKDGTKKDFLLTIELMLVALSTACATPGYLGLLHTAATLSLGTALAATPLVALAPLAIAGVVTWGVVRLATYGLTKIGLQIDNKRAQDAISIVFGWAGTVMLTRIVGDMMLGGATALLPTAFSSVLTGVAATIGTGFMAPLLVGAAVGLLGLAGASIYNKFTKHDDELKPAPPEKAPLPEPACLAT